MTRRLRNIRLNTTLAVLCGFFACQAQAAEVSVPRLTAAVKDQHQAAMTMLETLVNTPSSSRNAAGLKTVADYIADALDKLGAAVERRPNPPSNGDIIVGAFKGTGTAKILLLGHMDTVYNDGMDADWKFTIKGDKVYGPGVIDEKGGVTVILNGLAVLKKLDFHDYKQLTVLINADEETGSHGSADIISQVASENDVTLSHEPGGHRILLATLGGASLKMTVTGKTSHAGVAPQLGRNALVEMSDVIVRSRNLSDYDKGMKINWTIAQSGATSNQIPDIAHASADVRFINRDDVEAMMVKLRAIAADPVVPDTRVTLDLAYSRQPLRPTPASRRVAAMAVKAGEEFGYTLPVVEQPFGVGGSDAAEAQVSGKSIVLESFGPGGDHEHTLQEEYMNLDSIDPRVYVLARTVMDLSHLGPKGLANLGANKPD